MKKTALITGITGQDGSYLAHLLLHNNYNVIGLYRRSSTDNFHRINDINSPNFVLEEFDLTDSSGCYRIIEKYRPDELYNLAAQSHVGTSFSQPITTFQIDTMGLLHLLEAVRSCSNHTKVYQASTSEMFGSNYDQNEALGKYQNENTVFLPQSPYAVAKLASHRLIQIYREAYGLFACSGILFNHESPKRGSNFVTRKITSYIGQLVNNKISSENKLHLGNIEAHRDWGHAKDYVKAMHLMMLQEQPDDFVISTGSTHSVKEFLEIAFNLVGLNWQDYVVIDPQFYRPCEVEFLKGDSSKARRVLSWEPNISFQHLVIEMVNSDIEYYKNVS
jgi:GDPmannose 4,6-dehydratase